MSFYVHRFGTWGKNYYGDAVCALIWVFTSKKEIIH